MSVSTKSVIFDFADAHGSVVNVGVRSIDFYLGDSKITLSTSDFNAYATSINNSNTVASNAFDTALSKVDTASGTSWLSDYPDHTNQRLIIVFNTEQSFNLIRINNYHDSGGTTVNGCNNTVITITSDTYTDTTYNATISNGTTIYDDVIDIHTSSNIEDDFDITIYDSIAFSIPLISADFLAWSGNSILWPNIPVINPNIEATFHTPGIITDWPLIDVDIEGSFVPNVAGIDFTLPGLDFAGIATTNKIILNHSLPVFSCEFLAGAQIDYSLPKLSFLGSLETVLTGQIDFTLSKLDFSASSGAQIIENIPSISVVMQGSFIEFTPVISTDLSFFLPSLECNLIGTSTIGSSISFSLPLPVCEIVTENNTPQILRHIRNLVR